LFVELAFGSSAGRNYEKRWVKVNSNRKLWNQQQQALRHALLRSADHQQALELFLSQHAMVHSAAMSGSGLWSFADEIWKDLTEQGVRRIPRDCDHSVAWIMWHIARIEDVTMNMLVANAPQLLHRDGWLQRLKITARDTGNAMDEAAVADLSAAIDVEALRVYRLAVGRRTREIVKQLQPEQLKQKVDPTRLGRVLDERAVAEAARGLIDYWGKRDIAGLLLMPPTRHNFIHLNEAQRVKRKSR
jgi:hypothetical protein